MIILQRIIIWIVANDFILITDASTVSVKNSNNICPLHLLAFPKNKSLKTIRDLTANDILLLNEMNVKSKNCINTTYNIQTNEIESYFHYPPSVMLLHIHFKLLNAGRCGKILCEHSVHNVIENLKIDSEYYKKISIEMII